MISAGPRITVYPGPAIQDCYVEPTGQLRKSSSALASVTRLVQYCINTCSAVDAAQRTIPLLGRTVASQRKQMTLEEKAGQARDIDPLAGQVLGK
jgi:hypothetical protein